jgi:NADPH:quinone reductase-like Zn-dependent oxidoreductase
VRAVVQRGYGGPEVLDVVSDAPNPVPGPGEVVVDVRAAGIDRGTWHLMTGTPYAVRLGIGLRRPRQPVAGRDLAGVVTAVGEGVTGFAVGDEVFGTANGSLAEQAVTSPRRLARKPPSLTFEQAAAMPVSGGTALQALRAGHLQEGQRVLVVGASAGVGSYAVQLAKALGAAEVTGVCHGDRADFVRSLGADHVIDHTREDIDARGTAYDLVLDIGGGRPVRALRRVLERDGTLVIVGGTTGRLLGMRRQVSAAVTSPFVRQRMPFFVNRELGSDFEVLADLATKELVQPAVERVYPLEQVREAVEHLDRGVRGKLVVTV